ncbi:MAG TPA: sulfide/dihydroorotate dehydrogenase-like FAD/NAD-binding protein [Candidatus Pullichristensenella stercorigallinarum]|uniref:Sulfide/dihydroorotate dehydrogenase-like FAD/NAD-binding protein n=1 Tax=Candidatus Pullichristensenella stercorigallinarum TaxID=2840909 RepID=A0A9D0ZNG9_9FIRM|nr:sulfide/dihydroorotate dehydrogenase-like FAD/NAD-binding protein [Candidatus Pullichristensenella stercorigallinarum]
MFQILEKRRLNETTTLMRVHAPRVAKKAGPGQFIILRIDENGERIPLTIAGYDRESGSVTIIFQKVGKTTIHLDELEAGDSLLDFVGPLGRVSEYGDVKGKRVAVIGGGLGIAIAYPQAVALTELGAEVDMIVGFRNIGLAILMDELQNASKNLIVMTDDGSNGKKGFVTDALREQLETGVKYEHVVAIGPMPMMRAVCEMTRPYGIHTVVSMNPIMIDGTGMCGGCRLTVGGETKFACVDGPEFDGHLVDFDEAMKRSRMYSAEEKLSKEKHICRMKEAAAHV